MAFKSNILAADSNRSTLRKLTDEQNDDQSVARMSVGGTDMDFGDNQSELQSSFQGDRDQYTQSL
jgi:hypothetical protein